MSNEKDLKEIEGEEKPVDEVIAETEEKLEKARARAKVKSDSNPIVKAEPIEKKNPPAKAKKAEKKSEPKKYSSAKLQTYSTYTGTVGGIKRKDGKALRISYPVSYHNSVIELAKSLDLKISGVYALGIENYLKKNNSDSVETLAKQKKVLVTKITYTALKELLLKHKMVLPNNNNTKS